MINRVRWIAFGVLLVAAIGLLLARSQGIVTDTATSVIMGALIALATVIGVVSSAMIHRQHGQRE